MRKKINNYFGLILVMAVIVISGSLMTVKEAKALEENNHNQEKMFNLIDLAETGAKYNLKDSDEHFDQSRDYNGDKIIDIYDLVIVGRGIEIISGQDLVDEAIKQLGKPYQWGGNGPDTFDSTGFTRYIYNQVTGVDIGRSGNTQLTKGIEISRDELQVGDLVFITQGHVGIYVGENNIIHAIQSEESVKITRIDRFWRARRII